MLVFITILNTAAIRCLKEYTLLLFLCLLILSIHHINENILFPHQPENARQKVELLDQQGAVLKCVKNSP